MKNTHLDTSFNGILKSIAYGVICTYSWLEDTGINAYAFTVLIVFMSLDILLGTIKAKRLKELANPSSKEAKKGITTKAVMFMLPVVAGLLWGLFDKENAVKVANTLLIALALAEGYSVIGNSYMIASGKVVSEFDAVTFIFKSVSESIKKVLEKLLKTLD